LRRSSQSAILQDESNLQERSDMATPIELLGTALYGEQWKRPLSYDLRVPLMTLTSWSKLPEAQQREKLKEKGTRLLTRREHLIDQAKRVLSGVEVVAP
jgi:hypothetical protein